MVKRATFDGIAFVGEETDKELYVVYTLDGEQFTCIPTGRQAIRGNSDAVVATGIWYDVVKNFDTLDVYYTRMTREHGDAVNQGLTPPNTERY